MRELPLSLAPNTWVHRPHPLPQAALRLFCLPYGGGEASLFRHWPALLPPDLRDCIEICAIQLPGRAHRLRERPLCNSLEALIELLVPYSLQESPLYPYLDRPFAFFGASSFGGLICFELACALSLRHGREAAALCVAACRAPHLPGPYVLDERGQFSEMNLLQQLQEYGGTPAYILQDEQLMALARPKLMADSLLTATYSYSPDLGPDCPILVVGGTDDHIVSMADLAAWQTHTRQAFRLYMLPGDHFFVRDAPAHVRAQLLEYICRPLRPHLEQLTAGKTGAEGGKHIRETHAPVHVER